MNSKEITILTDRITQEFLPYVRRPSRYIGGEINQIKKNLQSCSLRVALCFPDTYEVGMSHTGLMIIYDILNKIDGIAAERVFAPWIDAEKIMRDKKIHLFSLESKAPLKSFDVIGFSLTNELCYTNVLNILDLAEIPLRRKDRSEIEPLIIGGGGMTNCCEPVADFFDLFLLGEGEEVVIKLAELIRMEKSKRTCKKEILKKAVKNFDWAYAPQLYTFEKNEGETTNFVPLSPGLRNRFENAVVEDFDSAPAPLTPIVPYPQTIHERISVEIMRGCPGRCRFCQASFCRRPVRFRSIDRIVEIAKSCYLSTGFDTVSLLSLSSGDYSNLEQLIEKLQSYFEKKHVGLSMPSLRVGHQLKLLPKMVTSVRKGGMTIAIEAASERLRQIINKPLRDEDLFAAVESVWQAGWGLIKLYFMVGLPGETEEEIKRIVELSYELSNLRKKFEAGAGNINITISWFVPKPHTPFGWLGQKNKKYFENAKRLIINEKKSLRAKSLQFKFHDIGRSILESAIGRGDRTLGDAIERAWKNGARFDLWNECFDYEIWRKAFADSGLDLEKEAQKQFHTEAKLPWEHLGGPSKDYLLNHLSEVLQQTKKANIESDKT